MWVRNPPIPIKLCFRSQAFAFQLVANDHRAGRRARSQNSRLLNHARGSGSKVGIAGAVRSNFALKARLPGTEFWDAETGRQKSSRKSVNPCRDQSPASVELLGDRDE